MKNIIKTVVAGLVATFILASCSDNDPAGLTRITHYPVFTLEGGNIYTVPVGSTYADPGFKAVEGTEDVTSKVVVSITDIDGEPVNSIETAAPTFYTVKYSAVNVDGFEASTTRTVFVYDPSITTSMEGTYSTDMTNSIYENNGRTYASYATAQGFVDQCVGIEFTELVPGIYAVNDIFGGWYAQIRNYGASYEMTGYVSLDSENKISLMSSYVAGWGDGLDYIKEGVYDPATKTISYRVGYAGQIYLKVVLNKD